jgi:transcriptional regulator with XRE-family HTH domain
MHDSERKFIDISKLKALLKSTSIHESRSSAEVEAKSGVHQSQISRIRRGEFRRITPNVIAVAEALGITLPNEKPSSKKRIPEVIQKALNSAWDGSDAQAQHYARLISAASGLAQR